jgi:hypothetical protein
MAVDALEQLNRWVAWLAVLRTRNGTLISSQGARGDGRKFRILEISGAAATDFC